MKISVRNHTGKTIHLWVETSDTIKAVKTKIQDKEIGIPTHQQELTFSDQELRDELTISDCKIEEEDTLRLYWEYLGRIMISVTTLNGKNGFFIVSIEEEKFMQTVYSTNTLSIHEMPEVQTQILETCMISKRKA